jgi:hypothetical protein
MSTRLASRLNAARQSRVVGRADEQALFQEALAAEELPLHVLHLFGPGGVGKSTLLRLFAQHCQQQQIPALLVDARNLEPTPEALFNALRLALDLPPQAAPLDAIAAQPGRAVVLLDTYEALAPLDAWLHESLLDEWPENALLVLAGRQPPSAIWRMDPAWQSEIRALSLRNLSPEESRDFLARRGVPPGQHQAVLDFTHGHPLALSLVADVFAQREAFQFRPEQAPDVVKALLEQFVQKVPGPAHRAALELCACLRLTTESLLAQVLGLPDAHELFEWLRGLSFIEAGQAGLFPHDLAREALAADLRWRNPDWYKELHKRARDYYSARIQGKRGLEQQQLLYDFVFLHRDNPVIRSMLEWQSGGQVIVPDALHPADLPVLLRMVEAHEGPEAARLAEGWLRSQPEGVTVYRGDQNSLLGFILMLALERAAPQERQADPAARLAWDYVQRHSPLRPGEVAVHYRFWMAADTYQDVSPVQTAIFLNTVRYQLTTPGLAYHFLPCAQPELWAGAFAYANLTRLPEADYRLDGRTWGVYVHDWRAEPPLAWLEMLAQRELAPGPNAPSPAPPPLVVLSQGEFSESVLSILRHFTHPDRWRENALLRSRLVMERAGATASPEKRAAALTTLYQEALAELQRSPRQARLYRAVYHTYIQPSATQEQAAELLDLPFSTYRRHLKAGIQRVTELLWQKELGAN